MPKDIYDKVHLQDFIAVQQEEGKGDQNQDEGKQFKSTVRGMLNIGAIKVNL